MQLRIMAIARLYDQMSQSARGSSIALQPYLGEIAESLSVSLLEPTSGIRIAVDAEALTIDSERAVPFGLLVNELSTNAVKHAFPGGAGLVTISARKIGDDIELKVADDGVGIQDQGEGSAPGKHGADYVAIFARQLRGVLVRSASTGKGTAISVRFPVLLDPHVDASS